MICNIKTIAMALLIMIDINYNRTIVIVDNCNNFVDGEKYFVMQVQTRQSTSIEMALLKK